MKHKVHQLDGALLDYCVAKAEGHEVDPPLAPGQEWPDREKLGRKYEPNYIAYSTEWQHGGPIIGRERMSVRYFHEFGFVACIEPRGASVGTTQPPGLGWWPGPTPLIACMRAYVAAKMGDEVDLS